jgi:multiple sugar transport system substrate-binding protein
MRKGFLIAVVLLIASGLAFAGGRAEQAPTNRVTIEVLSWRFDPDSAMWQAMVEAFNAKHPNIQVNKQMIPQGEMERQVTTMLRSPQGIDVVWTDSGRNRAFAERGLLENLGPWFERSGIDLMNDYFAQSINDHMWDGQILGWPSVPMSNLVFINKDLFDAAGIPYPSNDWTIEEFVETARALTNPAQNIFGFGQRPWMGTFDLAFIRAFGGNFFTPDGRSSALLEPGTIQAYELLQRLMFTYRASPPLGEAIGFEAGRVAMNWSGSWDIAGTEGNDPKWPFRWGVVMPPRGPYGQFPIVISNAWAMVSQSRRKDAAWQFMSFWQGEEGQRLLASFGEFPALQSVARIAAWTHMSEMDRATMWRSFDEGIARNTDHPGWVVAEQQIFFPIRQRIFLGNENVRTVLTEAAAEINQHLRQIGF